MRIIDEDEKRVSSTYKSSGAKEAKLFDIINAYIDFNQIILGMKLKKGTNFQEA